MFNYRELYLVIGLLAVLVAGLGAASLGPAARYRIHCAENLRRIHQAAGAYEHDYGCLPPVIIRSKPLWTFYDQALRSYVKDPLAFSCPADSRNRYLYEAQSPLFSQRTQMVHSYGMNRHLDKSGLRYADIRTPDRLVMLADALIPYIIPPAYWEKYEAPRHEGRSNYIFMDGHVQYWNRNEFKGEWKL